MPVINSALSLYSSVYVKLWYVWPKLCGGCELLVPFS